MADGKLFKVLHDVVLAELSKRLHNTSLLTHHNTGACSEGGDFSLVPRPRPQGGLHRAIFWAMGCGMSCDWHDNASFLAWQRSHAHAIYGYSAVSHDNHGYTIWRESDWCEHRYYRLRSLYY